MKMKYQLPIAIASMAFAASNVNAQNDDDGRIHNLTVSLKVSFNGDFQEVEKDNGDQKFSQKIVTEKFSNKQILEILVDEDVIDEIKGNSIVMLTDDQGGILGVFLRRNNDLEENISGYFDAELAPVPPIEGFKGTFDESENLTEEKIEVKTLGSVEFECDDFDLNAQGLFEAKSAFTDDDGEETTFIKTANFSELTGLLNAVDADDDDGVVSGGVKAGEGKKTDLED
jgi:hypothetical protein